MLFRSHFQRRCLGKIRDEIGGGRTVLFVSHNTSMILQVCTRCIWLDGGRLLADGSPHAVVDRYAALGSDTSAERIWDGDDPPGFSDGSVVLRAIRSLGENGDRRSDLDVKEAFTVEIEYEVVATKHAINLHLYVSHETAGRLFVTMDNLDTPWRGQVMPAGRYRARCHFPADFFNEGVLTIDCTICTNPNSVFNHTFSDALVLRMSDDMKNEGVRGDWGREWWTSPLRPRLKWQHG